MNSIITFSFFLCVLISCSNPNAKEVDAKKTNNISIGIIDKIYSEILDEEREIYIHMPEGFYGMNEQKSDHPILYITDGESQFKSTVGLMDQLSSAASANDIIPQMIVVGIPNTNRTLNLSPTSAVIGKDSSTVNNTGGADKFADFIEKELIPYIEQKYSNNPHRILLGHSLGGLFVLNTLLKRPHLFSNFIAIDPAMSWDEGNYSKYFLKEIKANQIINKSLFIALANNRLSWMAPTQVANDTTEIMKLMRYNLEFKDELESSDLKLNYALRYYENENHFQLPLIASYDAFRFLYKDFHFKEIMDFLHPKSNLENVDISKVIEENYAEHSKKMNYKVVPMESYINAWAFGFFQFQRPELAHSLFDLNIKNYPKSANVYRSKANFLMAQKMIKADSLLCIELLEKSLSIKDDEFTKEQLFKLKNYEKN